MFVLNLSFNKTKNAVVSPFLSWFQIPMSVLLLYNWVCLFLGISSLILSKLIFFFQNTVCFHWSIQFVIINLFSYCSCIWMNVAFSCSNFLVPHKNLHLKNVACANVKFWGPRCSEVMGLYCFVLGIVFCDEKAKCSSQVLLHCVIEKFCIWVNLIFSFFFGCCLTNIHDHFD